MSDERFLRTELMIGTEGLGRLRAAHVAVVGLGAVGGYAVEALARAGVGRLRLVDADVLRSSNLNRQLHALESTLGQPKVEAARSRVHDINPACRVEALRLFVHADTVDQVLAGPPDLVLDAIDSRAPKLELLSAVLQRGLTVISSMGAASRTDPALVRTGLLSNVAGCPLARALRKGLRRRGLSTDLPCVYSEEPASARFVGAVEDDPSDQEPCGGGRQRRILGSLPTLTGIFGLTAANLALRLLLGDRFPRPD